MPTRDWNLVPLGLCDTDALEAKLVRADLSGDADASVFSPQHAPLRLPVDAVRMDDWQMQDNAADRPPADAPASADARDRVDMLPYCCTNLRLAALPSSRSEE